MDAEGSRATKEQSEVRKWTSCLLCIQRVFLLSHMPWFYKSAFRLKCRCVCWGAALWRSCRCSMSVINQAGDHSSIMGKKWTVSQWVKKQRLIFQVFLPDEQTPFDYTSFFVYLLLILILIYWIFKIQCRQWLPCTKIWLCLEDILKIKKVRT